MILAVTGPSVTPIIPCPVATYAPLKPGTAPITGRPSAVHGLSPFHSLVARALPDAVDVAACSSPQHVQASSYEAVVDSRKFKGSSEAKSPGTWIDAHHGFPADAGGARGIIHGQHDVIPLGCLHRDSQPVRPGKPV